MKDLHRVISIRWYSPEVFELCLERRDIVFKPGDCVALFAQDLRTSRPYSFAGGAQEELLRIVVRVMPGGVVSGFLASRQPGDLVRVSPPFGWFRPGQAKEGGPFVFAATGTGISPFLSWLRTNPDYPPAVLLYGIRCLQDGVELPWLAERVPGLKVALSRERAIGHHFGRITDIFEATNFPKASHYYLCGLDVMIDELTRKLESCGVDITRIHRECFFNASYGAR